VKNLEKLAEEFENLSNQPKFFIGNVAKALGAQQYGSGSQYATFETKNGQIVTIRLADHNAHTSGFDYSGKDNGISIVISAKKNSGINNDGNAHIVEYYYDAIKLRRANGKPLADIVRAIQQSLYSGEFKDPTGLAEREEVNVSSTANEVKFLRTDSGEVYGFTKDGKIYIDPRKATAETPVHEFTHLWADGLRKANPKAWERLKGELEKEKDLFDYVKSLYPELSGDDLIDEVFAHFSGRRGAERLRSEQDKMMQKANGVFDKAKITTMFDKLRNMLHDFWAQARDLFAGKTEGIERLSAEDFADMALADLIKGEKPLVEGKKETRFNKIDNALEDENISEYSFRTLRSDRFYNGISNSDAFAELLDENTSWVDGSLNLLRALKKRFGGEVVSASSGAKYALEHGLVPVPDGKYSGKDGEYHHIEFESDNGERFVESVPFVDAESVGDDYGIRYSESDGVSARADMDRAHEVAEEWTEKLNLNDDVQIVDELTREMVDELMPNASEEVKEKALKAKGWFNEKTGKIVIAIGNHRNAEDVMQTILHEGVAHYGLRKLFGENFNTFLDNVYASADASVRKRIDVLQENKGYGRREAVEEYLAGLAEVTDFESVVSRTWWEKVKSLFADMLNSIGLSDFADNSLPLSDNELRYILWRSYDNLKSDNDVFRQAKDIAMQSELKVGNYEESKDATLGELVSGDRQLRERFGDEEGYNTGEEATDFHTVIDEIFDNADFDKSVHQRERYDLGKTPTWMKRIGIAGDRFSLSFKNIKTHKGKDADHDLTREEWHQLPDALKNPFAVTRYNDANDRFRLYVNVMHNGNYVAVGVDVKCVNQGRNLPMMEVSTIKTVFAHHGEIGGGEKLITYDKEITPKQEALLRGLNFREYPTIQELSAAKITNNSHMRSIESKKVDEKNYLYREQDESEDVYDAGRRSLEETLTQGLIDLSEKNRSDVGLRISAMKAISSNLSELRSAMSRQRDYDKSTVNRIVRWARMLMESGIGGNLTRYEVKRLTGMITQAAGKEDITRQAGQVMDLLINNQLRASKDLLQKQIRIKGSKIDSRGVEVQGALDIRGQRMIGAFKEGISLGEDAFYGLPVCRNIKRPFGNFRFATIAKSIPNSRMTQQRYYKILRTYVLHQDFRFVIVAFSVCCFYHVDAFWQVYHSSSADGMLLNDCSGNVVNVDDCLRRAVDHAFPVYVSCAEMLFVCHIFYFICFIFQCCDREYGRLIAVE